MLSNEWKYYLGRYKNSYSKIILSAVISVGLTVFVLPTIYMVKYVFDELLPAENYDMLIWVGIALVLINIIAYGLTVFASHLALKTTKRVITEIRTDLADSSFRMSRTHFTSTDLGKMHASMVQDTQRLDMMSNALISQVIPNAIIVAVLAVVLLYLNWMLFLTVSIIVPFLLFLKQIVKDKRTKKIKKYHLSFEQFSKGTMHILQRMDLIKTQSAEEVEHHNQVANVEAVKTDGYSMAFFNNAYRLMQGTIAAQIGVVMLVVGGMAVGKGTMTIGALLSFYVAAARMSTSLNALFDALPVLIEGKESLITLFKILEVETESEHQETNKVEYEGNLIFNSVSFGYGGKQVLNEVNFILKEHAITALVGANGTGKSTIVNLILGFYQPISGNILLNGTKFLNVNYTYLRQQYGVVLQDQFFFSGTIRENLTYGLFQVSEKEIKTACDFSNATEFITKLRDGVDTKLGDNGVLLSGGQKQKIAIARAVLRRPKLLILDEPTNHLDSAMVSLLMDRLKSLDFKPTVLIITQDRNLAKEADYVFESTEQGKVNELELA